jgi:hypothetical protein
MSKRFRGLPKKQEDALAQIAILSDGTDFTRSVVKALEEKGLIVGVDEATYGPSSAPIDRIPIMVRRYHVPLPIHMEWCQWCSDHIEEDVK